MKQLKKNGSSIFMLIIAGLSLLNIALSIKRGNFYSDIISVVGILAASSFIFRKESCRYFSWIWIIAQVIIIDHVSGDPLTHVITKETIFDFSQVLHVKIGFYISESHSAYVINLNLLTIIYFFLIKNLKINSLIGKTLDILIMKRDLDIHYKGDLFIALKERVTLDGDNNWLLGLLNRPIVYNQHNIDKILVYTENERITDVFRIVPSNIVVNSENDLLSKYERADWIMSA